METLDSLRRRIESARELGGIVRTMKALAVASIRQFERSVEAIDAYNQTVDDSLRILLQNFTTQAGEPRQKTIDGLLAVIFGSDQGMCGQFNENIIEFALRDLADTKRLQVVVGMRAAARLEEAESDFLKIYPVPSAVEGINPAVYSLLLKIQDLRNTGQVEHVNLYYNHPISGSSYQPTRVQLVPVDLERFRTPPTNIPPSRSLPVYTMEGPRLLSALLGQYLFAQLYRAYAESLTSENTSRLMTMQSAEKNIEERLEELNTLYHSQRQGQITSELLDIVSGVEALTGGQAG
jgi:F-type H+-transporting ATPase subunit gamma